MGFYKLLGFGNTAVAAMGMANKINTLAVLLESGLCVGVQALIAYNYGAKNKNRLMEVFCFATICAVAMGIILTSIILTAFAAHTPVWLGTVQAGFGITRAGVYQGSLLISTQGPPCGLGTRPPCGLVPRPV